MDSTKFAKGIFPDFDEGNDGSGDFVIFGRRYRRPTQTIIEKVRTYMGSVVKEVLHDEKVNTEGLNFLDRLFRHPQTHEAGQFLLVNVLKDTRFVDSSKVWGTDLIAHVIR